MEKKRSIKHVTGRLLIIGILMVLGACSQDKEIAEIKPRPAGIDRITYDHALMVVETAKGFTGIEKQLKEFRQELKAQKSL